MPVKLAFREFSSVFRKKIPSVLYRRFSRREHAEAFINDGELIFRNLCFYRGMEEGKLEAHDPRLDPHEGTFKNVLPRGTAISIQNKDDGRWIPLGDITSYTQSLSHPERFYIYCLSTKQHEEQEKFENHLVRIHNTSEFISRIASGVLKRKHLCWGKITVNLSSEYPLREEMHLSFGA